MSRPWATSYATLFFLRRRPGIARGVVWGFAVSGLGAYGLSQKQPVRWRIAAIAVHTTKNLFPSLSAAFDDAIWPVLAGMAVVLAVWVATIRGIIVLRKKAAANPPLSPAPARA